MPMDPAVVPTAHVLLDTVAAWDNDLSEDENSPAVQLAADRLLGGEVEPVRVEVDVDAADDVDVDVQVTVNITPLLGAAVVPMKWLVGRYAVVSGKDELEVIADLREFLDSPDE